ncbi:MAG: hypothetical protein KAS72_09140 [Phycisphaerales bacterium]|nr:hypothetical protein [Phycisphaerales bacterium]
MSTVTNSPLPSVPQSAGESPATAVASGGLPGMPIGAAASAPAQGVLMSEEQYNRQLTCEDWFSVYGFMLLVAFVCGSIAIAATAYAGYTQAVALDQFQNATTGALLGGLGYLVAFGLSVPIGVLTIWLIGKMFSDDVGRFNVLVVRTLAAYAACDALSAVVGLFVSPLVSLIVVLPISLVILAKIYCIGFFETVVLVVIRWAISFMLGMLLFAVLFGAMMASA